MCSIERRRRRKAKQQVSRKVWVVFRHCRDAHIFRQFFSSYLISEFYRSESNDSEISSPITSAHKTFLQKMFIVKGMRTKVNEWIHT